jgi:hypothetical protein
MTHSRSSAIAVKNTKMVVIIMRTIDAQEKSLRNAPHPKKSNEEYMGWRMYL